MAKLWNEQADAEIKADITKTQRFKRWRQIENTIDRLPYVRVSDEALDLFERAIAALNPQPEQPA